MTTCEEQILLFEGDCEHDRGQTIYCDLDKGHLGDCSSKYSTFKYGNEETRTRFVEVTISWHTKVDTFEDLGDTQKRSFTNVNEQRKKKGEKEFTVEEYLNA